MQIDATSTAERQVAQHHWKHHASVESPQLLTPVWLLAILSPASGAEGYKFEPCRLTILPRGPGLLVVKDIEAGDVDEAVLRLGRLLFEKPDADRVFAGLEFPVEPIEGKVPAGAVLIDNLHGLVVQ